LNGAAESRAELSLAPGLSRVFGFVALVFGVLCLTTAELQFQVRHVRAPYTSSPTTKPRHQRHQQQQQHKNSFRFAARAVSCMEN